MRNRPKLGDVTNVNQPESRRNPMAQEKNVILRNAMVQQEKANPVPPENSKERSKLSMENEYLLKLLSEKNQIIHRINLESQKLQMALQKLQFQNLHLAKTNTLMLAELGLGKDKIKVLQHQLTCTEAAVAILKQKNLPREEKKVHKKQTQETVDQPQKKISVPSQGQEVQICQRKQSSDIKLQVYEPKLLTSLKGTLNEDQHIQVVSSTSTNLKTAPSGQGGNETSISNSDVEILEKPQENELPEPSQGQEVRRSKRRESSGIKLQVHLPKLLINSKITIDEDKHNQVFSSTNVDLHTSPYDMKDQGGDRKTFDSSAELVEQSQEKMFAALSQAQEVEKSKRRQSSGIKLQTEHNLLVSSADTNLSAVPIEGENQNGDRKTSHYPAEIVKQVQKRKNTELHQGHQEVPKFNQGQSKNIKLESCEPNSTINLANNSGKEGKYSQSISSGNSNANILPIEQDVRKPRKRKLSTSSGTQALPTRKSSRRATIGVISKEAKHIQSVSSGNSNSNTAAPIEEIKEQGADKPQKRKASALFGTQEFPRSTVTTRPSRRTTIGVSYKEVPVNCKMRRNS